MSQNKYSPELRAQVIKDFENTSDAKLVAARHSIPEHAVYRIRREQLASPGLSKDITFPISCVPPAAII